MRDLAILGGKPAFTAPLHVGRPSLGDRERFLAYVAAIYDSGWLTNHGPLVRRLERELSDFLGVRHCIAVCNATVGLEVAIRALGLTRQVIAPSFTFIATAHALQWQGISPIFCDIDPLTHNLDPKCVEKMITPQTSGILGVHLWGRPCDIEALGEIADRHKIKLLFDAAHAFGCSYKGKMIGNYGNAEVISFHATKIFHTFEGGAVVTNDDALASRIRQMINFGFVGYDEVNGLGINGKMSEISGAMGITNMRCYKDIAEANHKNYRRYQMELSDIPGMTLMNYEENEKGNYQYIVVLVEAESAGLCRDLLIEVLHAENVLARRYFWPGCHRMEPYRTMFPEARLRLPRTEQLAERILILPTGAMIGKGEIEIIGDILRTAIASVDRICERKNF